MGGNGEYDRVALVTDIRGGTNFDGLFQALDSLKAMKCEYRIVFMDASDEVIIRRYKETRRSHPLAEECDSLEEAIALERKMLAPLKERADWVIDTSKPVRPGPAGGAAAHVLQKYGGAVHGGAGDVLWLQARHSHRGRPGV